MTLAGRQLAFAIHDDARTARSMADARVMIGGAAEEIAAERLSAERLQTDARNWYCPDLRRGAKHYEVKACGRSRQIIIYNVRLEKDKAFAADHPLFYVVVSHKLAADSLGSLANLRTTLRETATMHVFPFSVIAAVCASRPSRILNPKYNPANGWCQRGYETGGWCVPLKALHAASN